MNNLPPLREGAFFVLVHFQNENALTDDCMSGDRVYVERARLTFLIYPESSVSKIICSR